MCIVDTVDKKEKTGDVLLQALIEELAKRNSRATLRCLPSSTFPKGNNVDKIYVDTGPNTAKDRNRTVYIECDDNDSDLAFKKELKTFLESENFLVWDNDQPGRTHAENLEYATTESKWSIFILSKAATDSTDFPLLNFKCRNVLHQSIQKNELCVIPILDGIDGNKLLYELGWVTYLNKTDENLWARLLETLRRKW